MNTYACWGQFIERLPDGCTRPYGFWIDVFDVTSRDELPALVKASYLAQYPEVEGLTGSYPNTTYIDPDATEAQLWDFLRAVRAWLCAYGPCPLDLMTALGVTPPTEDTDDRHRRCRDDASDCQDASGWDLDG